MLRLTKQELNGTNAVLFILQQTVWTIQVAGKSCLFIFYSKWETIQTKNESHLSSYMNVKV